MKQTLYPPGGTRICREQSKLQKTSSRRRSIWTRGIKTSQIRKPEEHKNLQHLVEKQYQRENQRHPQRRKPWQKYLCTRVGTLERTDLAVEKVRFISKVQCFSQRSKNLCSTLDESPVEVEDTKKLLETLLVHRVRKSRSNVRMILERKTSLTKIFNLGLGSSLLAVLMLRSQRRRQLKTWQTWWRCDSEFQLAMSMSSTHTKQLEISPRIWSIIL